MIHVLPRKVVGHDTLMAQSKSPPCSTTADHSQKDCTWNGWYQLVNPWGLWDLSEAKETIEHSQYIYIYVCMYRYICVDVQYIYIYMSGYIKTTSRVVTVEFDLSPRIKRAMWG